MLLSPSKTQDFGAEPRTAKTSEPQFQAEARELAALLHEKGAGEIGRLMKINADLAQLNAERYQAWAEDTAPQLQALYAYTGEVYRGLAAGELSASDAQYAQSHLRILTGLYGVLRPLDLIRPYRLEMGAPLRVAASKNLYEYWGAKPTEALREALSGQANQDIVNLASQEYAKALKPKKLPGRFVSPEFRERRGDEYKVLAVYAKNARGRMAHWVIRNRVDSPEQLKDFREDGYLYHSGFSKPDTPVFVRDAV